MPTICVIKIPETGAPYLISEQWYGVEMELAEDSPALSVIKGIIENCDDYYFVTKSEVLLGFRKDGKFAAADYYEKESFEYIALIKTDCNIIASHTCRCTEATAPFCAKCGHLLGGF